jgi:hypothetical protein
MWALFKACCDADPDLRPSIDEVLRRLQDVVGKFTTSPQPENQQIDDVCEADVDYTGEEHPGAGRIRSRSLDQQSLTGELLL